MLGNGDTFTIFPCVSSYLVTLLRLSSQNHRYLYISNSLTAQDPKHQTPLYLGQAQPEILQPSHLSTTRSPGSPPTCSMTIGQASGPIDHGNMEAKPEWSLENSDGALLVRRRKLSFVHHETRTTKQPNPDLTMCGARRFEARNSGCPSFQIIMTQTCADGDVGLQLRLTAPYLVVMPHKGK